MPDRVVTSIIWVRRRAVEVGEDSSRKLGLVRGHEIARLSHEAEARGEATVGDDAREVGAA